MKKMLLIIAMLISFVVWADPGDKILRSFHDAFPNADTVTWYENESGYEAFFTIHAIKCRIWYDREGKIMKCIRYYQVENLHPFILAKLHTCFPGRSVYGVTEESSDEGIKYHVTLEDANKWYLVSGDYLGNFSVDRKFKKAPHGN
jgi:hypothetical protein